MKIIGGHYHLSFQQIAWWAATLGSMSSAGSGTPREKRKRFYESLSGAVRVGVESSGNLLWFERRGGRRWGVADL